MFWEESEPGYVRDHLTAFGELFIRAEVDDYDAALAQIKAGCDIIAELSDKGGRELAVIVKGVEGEIRQKLTTCDRMRVRSIIHVID